MCCILCEEPVRSVLVGLAAIGVVSIARTVQKSVKRFTSKDVAVEPGSPQPCSVAQAESAS